jgi:peptidoglycan/xylan/chitin deacetylase (PgdA/CDA1 family)
VLDALDAVGAQATFFFLVEEAEREPDIAREARRRGHAVGLHGIDHVRLDRGQKEAVERTLTEGRQRLTDVIGEDISMWRPPFGRVSLGALRSARRHRLTTVLWSHDPRDWEADAQPRLSEDLAQCAVPGAIVLLHDGAQTFMGQGATTAEALRHAFGDAHPSVRFVAIEAA